MDDSILTNLRTELESLRTKQRKYDAVLALAKDANVVIVDALKFVQGCELSPEIKSYVNGAMVKYAEIKQRARNL